MAKKLIQLLSVKRYTYNNFLFLSNRAYLVNGDTAEDMCDIDFRDMPIFKIIKESRAEQEGLAIVDLSGGTTTKKRTRRIKPKVAKTKVQAQEETPNLSEDANVEII